MKQNEKKAEQLVEKLLGENEPPKADNVQDVMANGGLTPEQFKGLKEGQRIVLTQYADGLTPGFKDVHGTIEQVESQGFTGHSIYVIPDDKSIKGAFANAEVEEEGEEGKNDGIAIAMIEDPDPRSGCLSPFAEWGPSTCEMYWYKLAYELDPQDPTGGRAPSDGQP